MDLITPIVAGTAGLGVLGVSSFRRGGEKKGFVHDIKNALTATAVPSERPADYTTIESALKDEIKKKDKTAGQKAIGMIKTGHILGSLWLLLSALPFALKKFFDFDSDSTIFKLFKIHLPFGIIGGIGSFLTATFCKNDYENSMVNVMDEHVTRYQIKKDGSAVNLKENTSIRQFPVFNDVVLPESPTNIKQEIETELKEAKHKGRIFNLRGVTGCGKTMTAEALADGIMKQEWYTHDSVQIWEASQEIMDKTMFDHPEGRMIKSLLEYIGIKINTESRTERLERLVANAVAHHKKTGEYVILILNEGHKLFGMDHEGTDFDPNNPFSQDPTVHAMGNLFDTKLKQQICKGAILAITSNAAAKQMGAFMERRVKDIEYGRPDKETRKKLLKLYLSKELDKNDNPKLDADNKNRLINFTESDFDEVASEGEVNLYKEIYDEQQAQVEAAGLLGHIAELKCRPMLHCENIKDAVRSAALNYQKGGTEELKIWIKKYLKDKTTEAVKARDRWKREIILYSGGGTDGGAPITRGTMSGR